MKEDLLNLNTQFDFNPEIVHGEELIPAKKFVVCGMGGSHLGADLLKIVLPELDFHIHKNYGLPVLAGESSEEHLFIAVSYSGNTEETISFAKAAFEKGLNLAIVASGGELISYAEENKIPHIKIPEGVEPRISLGFQSVALSSLMANEEVSEKLKELGKTLSGKNFEEQGKEMADKLGGKIPAVYASAENQAIAYSWKIAFNETAKVPAFYNIFPELNHNEMQGFGGKKTFGEKFHFIFLKGSQDSKEVRNRMDVTKKVLSGLGLEVEEVEVDGPSELHRIFSCVLLGYWASYFMALESGVGPEEISLIEEFKKML